jgi:hypothetical protein
MNALEQYYKVLDNSSYDCKDVHTIDDELQQVIKQLLENGETVLASKAELDRQVFSVRKSFDTSLDIEKGTINGLSWKFSGSQTLEDGSEIPLYWPDVTSYTPQAFDYFFKRYNECENLFAKTEYGLMVYFGEKPEYAKHNNYKKQLFNDLFALTKQYYAKAILGGDKNYYSSYFFLTIRLAFGIVEKSKIEPELSAIIKYIFEIHQNWEIPNNSSLRTLFDLSGLMFDFYMKFEKLIDFQAVLDKNIEGAKEAEKTYIWGAMYAVDLNISIEEERKKKDVYRDNSTKSLRALKAYKAILYEKLAFNAEQNSNLACISFIEHALRIYQNLVDSENTIRLEKKYSELRGKFQVTENRHELSKEFNDSMNERILNAIAESNETVIIQHFITTPWYDTKKNIEERSIEISKQTVLLSMLPTIISDKLGNTVDVFNTNEQKEKFNFWHSYAFDYQVGTQTMCKFFIEAYKANKLNYSNVITYLENTWFNESILRKYHGQSVEVKPIDTLKPGLEKIFEELDYSFADKGHQIDFVTIIDSLTLKIEGLMRFLCERLGIATFKTKIRKLDSAKLVMEKLLDELLADIAHEPKLKPEQKTNFNEDDRTFIKFVLTEKVGLNLRHKIAHSLMDFNEYTFELVVVLFCIIMKLSKYKFFEIEGDKDHDSNIE